MRVVWDEGAGSALIQGYLAAHRSALLEPGINYPVIGRAEPNVRDYKAAFAARNPEHAGCLDDTPDSLSFAGTSTLADGEIFAVIGVLAERTS